jgi:RimJ/RimL family protein N-acetyltransferase
MSTRHFEPTPSWKHALEKINCSCHKLLVVEWDEKIVGWCRSFPFSRREDPLRAELGIGLLAQFRNQGIGTELVMRSLEWAEIAGLYRVDLTVSLENLVAIHVFRKCGFETARIYDCSMLMSVCLS